MASGKPRLDDQGRLAPPPQPQQPGKTTRQQWGKRLRTNLATKRRALTIGQNRRDRQIDAEADDHPVASALEQDSRQLLAQKKHVIGPFEHQRLAWNTSIDRLDQRQTGDERKSLRRRIALLQL